MGRSKRCNLSLSKGVCIFLPTQVATSTHSCNFLQGQVATKHCYFLPRQVATKVTRHTSHVTRRTSHVTLHEGTGARPDYLVNRVLTKNEGPLREKIARKSKNSPNIYIYSPRVEWAVGVWVHRDNWLGPQMGSVLEPNTNAQRMLLLSCLLRSAWYPLVPNCWSFPHSSQ